jgi:phenylpyruvate tautomerase PptA (4-oxalocrotonate tautomerase family)
LRGRETFLFNVCSPNPKLGNIEKEKKRTIVKYLTHVVINTLNNEKLG